MQIVASQKSASSQDCVNYSAGEAAAGVTSDADRPLLPFAKKKPREEPPVQATLNGATCRRRSTSQVHRRGASPSPSWPALLAMVIITAGWRPFLLIQDETGGRACPSPQRYEPTPGLAFVPLHPFDALNPTSAGRVSVCPCPCYSSTVPLP